MPNIGKLLKDEIQRISDKSARATSAKLRKEMAALKATLVAVRKDLAVVKKQRAAAPATPAAESPAAPTGRGAAHKGRKGGLTSKGVVSLRKRLGLTQTAFAKLAEVTPQSVTLWENKDGPLRLRASTAEKLEALKRLGKREVASQLERPEEKKPQPRKKTVRKKKTS